MTAYYNEIDPYAAQWLRNLIKVGHIAPGFVDETDIRDVQPSTLMGYTQCHFFAGIGVWSHALRRAGWSDERPIWTGSCPCQPFSAAGTGAGFADERHLWPHFHWLIEQCNPSAVLGEQVASKDGLQWLDLVSADLEGSGYAVGASDLCAAGFGGAHIRQRLYWVANADHKGSQGHGEPIYINGSQGRKTSQRQPAQGAMAANVRHDTANQGADGLFRIMPSGTFPLAHAAPSRVGRLRAYGNGLDAETATQFITAVMETQP